MGRGVGVVVAVASFLSCAPAWAGGAAATMRPTSVPTVLSKAPLALSARELSARRAPAATRPRGKGSLWIVARPAARLKITPGRLTYLGGPVTFKISSSHAAWCTLSASPRFWSGPNPARVRCTGKSTLKFPAVAFGIRWTFKLVARNGRRKAVSTRNLELRAPPFAVTRNWSGYVVPSSTPVTQVSGRFTVPTLNCSHTKTAGEALWVGIGGNDGTSGDLLQTGVRSDCVNGVQDNNPGWWEEYPELPATDFKSLAVSAGDAIQATVSQNPDTSWTTRVDDLTKGVSGVMTTGQGYGTVLDSSPTVWVQEEGTAATVSYAGGYTAEWIVEDFGFSDGSYAPFADFGTVAFTNLTTSLPSWSLTSDEQRGLGDERGHLLAAPSAPDATGYGFSVTYMG